MEMSTQCSLVRIIIKIKKWPKDITRCSIMVSNWDESGSCIQSSIQWIHPRLPYSVYTCISVFSQVNNLLYIIRVVL